MKDHLSEVHNPAYTSMEWSDIIAEKLVLLPSCLVQMWCGVCNRGFYFGSDKEVVPNHLRSRHNQEAGGDVRRHAKAP